METTPAHEPTPVPTDVNEYRRFRAVALSADGWRQNKIAQALGVTEGAVSQWLKRARQAGLQALRKRKAAGPTPRLTPQQKAQIPDLLARGAPAFGFRGEVWTNARVAAVIQQEFGVCYHPAHMSRLLQACRWSRQKPIQRATQRNEEAIRRWKEERWPALKKSVSKRSERRSS